MQTSKTQGKLANEGFSQGNVAARTQGVKHMIGSPKEHVDKSKPSTLQQQRSLERLQPLKSGSQTNLHSKGSTGQQQKSQLSAQISS